MRLILKVNKKWKLIKIGIRIRIEQYCVEKAEFINERINFKEYFGKFILNGNSSKNNGIK